MGTEDMTSWGGRSYLARTRTLADGGPSDAGWVGYNADATFLCIQPSIYSDKTVPWCFCDKAMRPDNIPRRDFPGSGVFKCWTHLLPAAASKLSALEVIITECMVSYVWYEGMRNTHIVSPTMAGPRSSEICANVLEERTI